MILEVGCGVGNFLFPLLEDDPQLYFHACDFSPRAVEFVKVNGFRSMNSNISVVMSVPYITGH